MSEVCSTLLVDPFYMKHYTDMTLKTYERLEQLFMITNGITRPNRHVIESERVIKELVGL